MQSSSRPLRVAVLGGGGGALAAAFYLTSTPELRQRYRVTVYQQGWRLGGKGASGRNASRSQRIEEHGVHMLMGWYENTFRLVRDCYAEWKVAPDNPFQSWRAAFDDQYLVSLEEWVTSQGPAHWETWNLQLPPTPGTPGDGRPDPTLWALLRRMLEWVHARSLEVGLAATGASSAASERPGWLRALMDRARSDRPAEQAASGMHPALNDLDVLARWMDGGVESAVSWLQGSLARVLPGTVEVFSQFYKGAALLVDEAVEWLEARFEQLRLGGVSDGLRRAWALLRLGMAVVRGFISDVLPYGPAGFDRINHLDFRQWLILNGAQDDEVNFGPPVRAFYDLAFAYRDGIADKEHADVAAGAALYSLVRIVLTYKGAPLWRMRAGMGDTIFSPLYEVLKGRGVDFRFFHRVAALHVAPGTDVIDSVDLIQQARLQQPHYQPLVRVKGLPCWPSEPHWEQLEGGEALRAAGVDFESAWCAQEVGRHTLRRGEDFDLVVLGIPVSALPPLTQELSARSRAWRDMLAHSRAVMTGAMQLWLTPTLEELGWKAGPTVLTTYQPPWSSWADMTEVLPREDWPEENAPRTLAYFCDVLPGPAQSPLEDPTFPEAQKQRVRQSAGAWLGEAMGHLWPKATTPDNRKGLDLELLQAPRTLRGSLRLDEQYWRANADPSERYVQTPPGSVRYRLDPGRSGFANLYLAGDWTLTSINGGSFEAAVESGMRASHAICGVPQHVPGRFGS